jgi:hypothetical protein
LSQAKKLNSMSKGVIRDSMNPLWANTASKLCAFRFADLRSSGTLSLVLSSDGGGTADCNNVEIIDKDPTGIEYYDIDGSGAYLDSVQNLNGNDSQELLIDQVFISYKDHCIATWPVIYAWTGSGYTDVSSSYRIYYEQTLVSLKKQIAKAERDSPKDDGQISREIAAGGPRSNLPFAGAGNVPEGGKPPPSLTANESASQDGGSQRSVAPQSAPSYQEMVNGLGCLIAEAVKIESFLGVSHDAYIGDAIRWADSEDSHDREFAAGVLFNIGTSEALDYLKTLSHDTNLEVAQHAKEYLARVGQPPPVYGVQRENFPMAQLGTAQ